MTFVLRRIGTALLALGTLFVFACGGSGSSSAPEASSPTMPPTAVATFPPAPAPTPTREPSRPVTATGEFTCNPKTATNGCWATFRSGNNTVSLRFDLAGGPVTGTAAGEQVVNSPRCTTDIAGEITFTGSYDPVLRKLAGAFDTKQTSTLARGAIEVCMPTGHTVDTISSKGEPWDAMLSDDGETVTGKLSGRTYTSDTTFVLHVK